MTALGRQAERVYRRLLEDIEQDRFPVHSALPAGTALCVHYGVSHPTLRKAIAALANESRLIVKQGAGTFVAPPPALRGGTTAAVSVMAITDDPRLRALQSLLLKRGYLMNVHLQAQAHWDATAEGKFLEQVKRHRNAALLAFCSPLPPTHETALRELGRAGVRVIHYEHYRVALPEQEYLLPDYARAGHMAALKLLLAGYAPLFIVGHWDGMPPPSTRLVEQGFARAVEEHGGGYAADRQLVPIYRADADYEPNLRRCVTELPANSGLVCTNIAYAVTLKERLAAAGRGPDQVGVVAIQNGNEQETVPVDLLHFQRDEQMRRLVDMATGHGVTEVRELIAPAWQPGGTTRARG